MCCIENKVKLSFETADFAVSETLVFEHIKFDSINQLAAIRRTSHGIHLEKPECYLSRSTVTAALGLVPP